MKLKSLKQLKKQTGLVLVTGLIFLLIAMLAAVSTLENAGILAYEQGNTIEKYRLFYQLETQLASLEKSFIDQQYHEKDLDNLIAKKHIKNVSAQLEVDFLEDSWQQKNPYLQSNKESLFLIEYLGMKIREPDDVFASGQAIDTWLFRISISSVYEQGYWLQSIIEVYPLETLALLKTENKAIKRQIYFSQRIAWYERIANE